MALFLPIHTALICASSLQVGNRPVFSPPFPEVFLFVCLLVFFFPGMTVQVC